ncbi:MAG: hypothetical protein AAGH81_11775 [Bacteroidota bacterium]
MRTIQVILCILAHTYIFGQDISAGAMDITWEYSGNNKIAFTATPLMMDGWHWDSIQRMLL